MKTYTCKQCNKKFTDYASNKRKFCSRECQGKRLRPERKTGRQEKCLKCGKSFYTQKHRARISKYCSQDCYWIDMKGKNRGGSKIIKCAICEKKIKIFKHLIKRRKYNTCGKECGKKALKLYTLDRASNWRGGKSFEPYTIEFDNCLKEKIRERDRKCQLCWKKKDIHERKLSVHHIDYDKSNCSLKNLITLCMSCNIKVNYAREYWISYFQNKINKIYK